MAAASEAETCWETTQHGADPSTRVTVSSRTLERGEQGLVLRLDPGSWTFTLNRPGYEPARRAVQLVHGRPEVLEVTMTLERPAPVVQPAPPASRVVDAPEQPPAVPRRLMLGLAIGGGAMAVGTRPRPECWVSARA